MENNESIDHSYDDEILQQPPPYVGSSVDHTYQNMRRQSAYIPDDFSSLDEVQLLLHRSIDIMEKSHGQYHVLVIIDDGQVSRSDHLPPGRFSPQEQATIDSIVEASQYPLSIILVGVGDGPWDAMKRFDDNIPQRSFDNFQTCKDCGVGISLCPMCREPITTRLRLYS